MNQDIPFEIPPIDLPALVRKALRPRPELPPIVTFAENPFFLGDGGPGLYPRQRTLLRLAYVEVDNLTSYDLDVIEEWKTGFYIRDARCGVPDDIEERLRWLQATERRHFGHFIYIGGRRGGKGHLGAVMASRELAHLVTLGDPQAHYGLGRGHHLVTMVTATNFYQARDNQFADIARMVANSPFFRDRIALFNRSELAILTDADILRCQEAGITDAQRLKLEASLRVRALSSNAPAGRGGAGTGLIMDECAHHLLTDDGSTAEDVYRALVPSLIQLGPDALVYLPSSPWTKESYLYTLYEHGLARDEEGNPLQPDFLVAQLPSWSTYLDWDDPRATEGRRFVRAPVLLDDDLRRKIAMDPASSNVEYGAQWREVEEGFLDVAKVDRAFEPYCPRHGTSTAERGECATCGEKGRHPQTESGQMLFTFRGHGDPGVSQSNYAMAIGHAEVLESSDGDPVVHAMIDMTRVWRPEDYGDRHIPYDVVDAQLAEIIAGFPTLSVFTFDQPGAFGSVSRLRDLLGSRHHDALVRVHHFSSGEILGRWEKVRKAFGQELVHVCMDDFRKDGSSLAMAELKALQLHGLKVEHPTSGPIRSKDLADCLSVVISELLTDVLERQPRRERLGRARLIAGPGLRGGGLGAGASPDARKRIEAISQARRMKNPYGKAVPWWL